MTPRYRDRKKTMCKVILSSGSRMGEGSMLGMTVSGCQLGLPVRTRPNCPASSVVDPKRPMRIDLGVVRWTQNGKAVIEFIRMVQEDQIRLRFFVGHMDKRRRPGDGWSEAPMCVGY